MKRPVQVPALDPDGPHSAVYMAARAEWNERYGSYIAQAHAWRLTALASLGVAFVAVTGVSGSPGVTTKSHVPRGTVVIE